MILCELSWAFAPSRRCYWHVAQQGRSNSFLSANSSAKQDGVKRNLPLTNNLEVVLDALVVDIVTLALLDDGHLDLLAEKGRIDGGGILGDGGGIATGEGSPGDRPEGGRSQCSDRKHVVGGYQLACSHCEMKEISWRKEMMVKEGGQGVVGADQGQR